ncbi:MAG: hypothetical protein M3018_05565, partial [Actinomycetota bacterium]|nr:hypothetical protein [Actinomycetota bacterium]
MPPLAILYDVHGNRPALAAVITEALGDAAVAELDSLPEQLLIEGIRACHASPVSDVRSFLPAPAPEDDELLAGAGER